jgi:hypothetical protein
VVDELDRCRPDFALSLLEKIKHLFDVKGVSFVILTDKFQLCDHIAHSYGIRSNDLGYISKFGDIFCDLPSKQFMSPTSNSGYTSLVYFWSKQIAGDSRHTVFDNVIIELVSEKNSSMRNVISMLKKGYLKIASVSRHDIDPVVLAMMSFMSVEHPERIRAAINCIDKHAEHMLWISCLNTKEVDGSFNANYSDLSSHLNIFFGDEPNESDRQRFQALGRTAGDIDHWFKKRKNILAETLIDFESITKLEP